MNFFQLILKQMRQRALSTSLTLLSVLLGVALATAILIFQREGGKLFGQSDFGYDLLVGPKGNKLSLVLSAAYHMGTSPDTLPYTYYEQIQRGLPGQFRGGIQWRVPYALGDSYEGHRIIGTLPKLFGVEEDGTPSAPEKTAQYRKGRAFELAEGRVFHPRKFEAIVGSEVSQRTGLKLGSTFKAVHGSPDAGASADEHDEKWTVVGVLKKTQTANDRVIYIPLISLYAVPEHKEAMEEVGKLGGAPTTAPKPTPEAHDTHDAHDAPKPAATRPAEAHDDHAPVATTQAHAAIPSAHDHAGHAGHDHEDAYCLNPDGTIDLHLPKEDWRISAILVRTRGAFHSMGIQWSINNGKEAMAVNPAAEMRTFFDTFLRGSTLILFIISILVTVVAAVSILVSIYNSISARRKEIAILRALGATRTTILSLICLEAALIGLIGGVLGVLAGHAIAAGGSVYLERVMGESIGYFAFGWSELLYLLGVVVLAAVAGLVPALKAYQTPVATHLVAS